MIYEANLASNTIYSIDGKTNTIVANIPVGKYPLDIFIVPNTNTVYVANRDSNSIYMIDEKTLER